MKPNEYLSDFVARALAAGRGRDEIAAALREAGWQASDIRRALAAWGDAANGLPVPRPAAHVSARDAFTYGLLFTGLAMLVWYINALGFDLIDRAVAQNAWTDWRAQSIRWSIAVLVVVAPAFLWLNRKENLRAEADAGRARSAIRKWFGFVTLYLAVLGLAGDLMTTVYTFLSGDLTVHFIAKAVLVMITAGLVFLYYLHDLRQSDED